MREQMTPDVLAAIRKAHTAYPVGVILSNGAVRSDLGMVPLAPAGSTTMDRTSLIRRKSSVTVSDARWLPEKASDPLAAFGKEMRVFWRITSPALPAPVLVPIITGHILNCEDSVPFDGISVQLVDRMWRCVGDKNNKFDSPRTVRGSALAALMAIVSEMVPWITFDVHPAIADNDTTITSPVAYSTRSDALDNLSTSLAADLPHCDADGVCRIWPVPTLDTDPVWDVEYGQVLIKGTRRWSSEAPNKFRAIGQSANGNPPMSRLVVDDDPTSPTFFGGVSLATGEQYPQQYQEFSGVMDTKAKADAVAVSMFAQYKGQAKSVDFGSVANAGLEDGDVIRLRRSRREAATAHLLDAWSLDHRTGTMQGSSRARTLADAS